MSIREISKKARMSFRDIAAIQRKAAGEIEENQEKKKPSLSPSAQAYRLFSEGKTLVEVAISLDLPENEVTNYYEEYLNLKQMYELKMVHNELGPDIAHFLRLFRILKKERINPPQIVNLLRTANKDLPALEHRYYTLNKDIVLLEQTSKQIGGQVRILAKVSEDYKQELEDLNLKKIALQNLISKFEDDKDYKKIRGIAEEEVINTLTKSRELITLAIASVLESIMKDPNKYNFLINRNLYDDDKGQTPHPNFIEIYQSLILDDSRKLFEAMARELTNRIIESVILKTCP